METKNVLLVCTVLILVFLGGCTSSIPISKTGNSDEYVVVARNMAGPFSSLELAQQEAITRATEYCKEMGKVFVQKYAIDRPMAIAQAPESTLFFGCADRQDGVKSQPSGPNPQPVNSKDIYSELTKLDDLRKKGIISDAEFEIQKKKILTAN